MNKEMNRLFDMIEKGVESIYESKAWKKHLNTITKFHKYSFNNTILIGMQKPNASLVAGYGTWKKDFNRYVKKGEKAIKIIAPVTYKIKEEIENENGEIEVKKKKKVSFRSVNVFDISQTAGEEVELFTIEELNGSIENGHEVLENLINQVHSLGLWFKYEEMEEDINGYFSPKERMIAIEEKMSVNQKIKTLIHEIAHAKLHDFEQKYESINNEIKEVQAESVAYIVSHKIGLDTSEYSFSYIAGWAVNIEKSEMRNILETIQTTANEIILELDYMNE